MSEECYQSNIHIAIKVYSDSAEDLFQCKLDSSIKVPYKPHREGAR